MYPNLQSNPVLCTHANWPYFDIPSAHFTTQLLPQPPWTPSYTSLNNCNYLTTLSQSCRQPLYSHKTYPFLTKFVSVHCLRPQRFSAYLLPQDSLQPRPIMSFARKGYCPPAVKRNPLQPPTWGRRFHLSDVNRKQNFSNQLHHHHLLLHSLLPDLFHPSLCF